MMTALPRAAVRPAVVAVLLAAGAAAASPLEAQAPGQAGSDTLALSLDDALRRGFDQSEEVRLARSQVGRARAQVREVRAALFPQVSLDLSYLRTLRSPFSVSGLGTIPDSLKFEPDSTAPLDTRVRYLEKNAGNAAFESLGKLFSGFPIGQKNTYLGRITVRQTLFNAGVFVGVGAAEQFVGLAEAQETEQEADLRLAITEAYYDAVLAERFAAITDSATRLLDDQLGQVRLTLTAGNASELDALRVQVDRQNLEPERVAALNQRDLALLNLKRLINLPADAAVRLTDGLAVSGFRPLGDAAVERLAAGALARRARVVAAERQVALRERQVSAVKAAYLPSVGVSASFGKQALPRDLIPSGADFRDDWSIGVGIQVPLFTGGRRAGQVAGAEAELRQAELQLAQTKEAVTLDVERQRGELRRASALIAARAQTTAQAERVYRLTDLSYRQGVTTYLQLSDARLALSRSRTNEAQAVHDYYLALARLQRAAGSPVALDLVRAAPPAAVGGN